MNILNNLNKNFKVTTSIWTLFDTVKSWRRMENVHRESNWIVEINGDNVNLLK